MNIYFLFLVIYSALILYLAFIVINNEMSYLGTYTEAPEGKYKTFWAFFASQVFH